MPRQTKTCGYDFEEIGFRGNKWISGCGKEILYVSPLDQGVASPPLPTDNGAKFCTFCGKKIRLTSRKPKHDPVIPKCPEGFTPHPKSPFTGDRPVKPDPVRPQRVLVVDSLHNTYDGWKALGHQVQAGSKSIGRDPNGIALFYKDQTKPAEERPKFSARRDEGYDFPDDDIPF